MYDVYLITNTANGKKYVGITNRGAEYRFKEHFSQARCGSRQIIHCAMRKYGEDSFKLDILETDVPESEIQEKERYYIRIYDSYYKNRHGYNMTFGGNGTIGYVFTNEVREKMRKAMTGYKFSAERNERIRKAMIGRDYKPEWRAALSAARIGRFGGKNNSFYGKHHTDVTKKTIGMKNTKYRVYRLDKDTLEVIEVYESAMDAARWVIENGLSSVLGTCNTRILFVCDPEKNRTAYGFRWRLEKKCID